MAVTVSSTHKWGDVFTLAGFAINKSGKLPDTIFKGLAGLDEIMKNGIEYYDEGGEQFVEPLAVAKNTTFKPYRGRDVFVTEQKDQITAARYQIKQHGGTVTFDGFELETQNGSHGMRSLFKSRIELAIMSARDDVSRLFYLDGTDEDGKAFTGLKALVPENGLGTYGGLDSSESDKDYWRPYVDTIGSWSSNSNKKFRKAIRKVSAGRESGAPNLILMTEGAYGFYEDSLHAKDQFMPQGGGKPGDASFGKLTIYGIPMRFDLNMPLDSGGLDQIYILNTRYFYIKLKRSRAFRITPFTVMPKQDAVIAKILTMGEFISNNRRHNALLKGITE